MTMGIVWTFLLAIITSMVSRVIFALGIGFTVYSGATASFDFVKDWVIDQFAGLPTYMVQMMGILRLDDAMSMILSAYAALLALKAVAGVFRTLTWGLAGSIFGD